MHLGGFFKLFLPIFLIYLQDQTYITCHRSLFFLRQQFIREKYTFIPGLTFLDSLWLEQFPDSNAACHALQADTCEAAAPQCLHLGSLEFEKYLEACVATGVRVLSCVL